MTEHTYRQFDADIDSIRSAFTTMGGLVERQLLRAVDAVRYGDLRLTTAVLVDERQINQMQVESDLRCNQIIAKRQPTANDLRLLMAISKATANLERAGDEAAKIARMVKSMMTHGGFRALPSSELRLATEMASNLLRKSLDAFARLDTATAVTILKEDDLIDKEFDGFVRKLITYMMEDPRTISSSLDLLFVAKALERIGDHAKNIAELIIYIVKGEDVRHASIAHIESTIK